VVRVRRSAWQRCLAAACMRACAGAVVPPTLTVPMCHATHTHTHMHMHICAHTHTHAHT
jgi:hypothetical protein